MRTHLPCGNCGSSDALTDYGDHTHCFSCGRRGNSDGAEDIKGNVRRPKNMTHDLIPYGSIEYVPINSRNIRLDTCTKFGVGVADGNKLVFPYYDAATCSQVTGQKLKTPDKRFSWTGDASSCGLFGMQVWRNERGKRLVITEGELDCLSVSQAFNNSWPVVSIRSGAQGAARDIKEALEFVESFDEVVLWFDNDEPGIKATETCMSLVTPGKCKIVHVPPASGFKDASDVLIARGIGDVQRFVYEAKVHRPDGVIYGTEIYDRIKRYRDNPRSNEGFTLTRFPKLNEMLRGVRKGKLYSIIAAPKVGKSTLVKEIAYDLLVTHGLKIATFAIEESIDETALLFMGMHLDKRIHLNPKESCTDEEFDRSYTETVGNGRMFMFDHFGSIEPDNLFSKFRYMAISLGVDFIIFDHVSIVVSGLDTVGGESERRVIGIIETRLRQLIQETGVGVLQVAHIRKGQGKGNDPETGGRVSPSDVLGSGDIGRISDFLIAMEGDVSGDDQKRTIRLLYNRATGEAGEADTLDYSKVTGRLSSVAKEDFSNEEQKTTDF